MLTLGIDTSLQRCSAAIIRHGEVAGMKMVDMERGHAEHLAPMVADLLRETGITVAKLDRVGVVIGPGGFTGVRIALSFARGLVLGVKAEAVGVTSLAALAAGAMSESVSSDALIAPIIDARRGQVYAGLYEADGKERLVPFIATPEEAFEKIVFNAKSERLCLLGTGADLVASSLPEGWQRPHGYDQIHPLSVARIAASIADVKGPPAPLYLRAPDAKPPSKPSIISGLTTS